MRAPIVFFNELFGPFFELVEAGVVANLPSKCERGSLGKHPSRSAEPPLAGQAPPSRTTTRVLLFRNTSMLFTMHH
jgi:hypothetical protein